MVKSPFAGKLALLHVRTCLLEARDKQTKRRNSRFLLSFAGANEVGKKKGAALQTVPSGLIISKTAQRLA
jgi:hypothetical protein